MKLDALKFGLAAGILWALAVLCLGIIDMWGWGGGLVKGLGSLYIGYQAGIGGAVLGMIWAFFDGGIGALILALIYNKLLGSK